MLDQLPIDAFSQVWARLTPTSRLMVRQMCRSMRHLADNMCVSLMGVALGDIAVCGVEQGSRFGSIQRLSISLSDSVTPQNHGSASATCGTGGPEWPVLLSRLGSLRRVTITECQCLNMEMIQAFASSCHALLAFNVHQGPVLSPLRVLPSLKSAGLPPTHGRWNSNRVANPCYQGDNLMRACRQSGHSWALSGLTFAPLATCAQLREMELYGMPRLQPVGKSRLYMEERLKTLFHSLFFRTCFNV